MKDRRSFDSRRFESRGIAVTAKGWVSKDRVLQEIMDAEFVVGERAEKLFRRREVVLSNREESKLLYPVSLQDLGLSAKHNLHDIYDAAKYYRLRPCGISSALAFPKVMPRKPRTGYVLSSDLKLDPDENEMCDTGLFVATCLFDGQAYLDAITVRGSAPWGAADTVFIFEPESRI